MQFSAFGSLEICFINNWQPSHIWVHWRIKLFGTQNIILMKLRHSFTQIGYWNVYMKVCTLQRVNCYSEQMSMYFPPDSPVFHWISNSIYPNLQVCTRTMTLWHRTRLKLLSSGFFNVVFSSFFQEIDRVDNYIRTSLIVCLHCLYLKLTYPCNSFSYTVRHVSTDITQFIQNDILWIIINYVKFRHDIHRLTECYEVRQSKCINELAAFYK